jgi:FkbM family methyltransferase
MDMIKIFVLICILILLIVFDVFYLNLKEPFETKDNKLNLVTRKRKIFPNSLYTRGKLPSNKDIISVYVQDFKFFIDNELNNINNATLNIIDNEFKSVCESTFNYRNFLENKNITRVFVENWKDKPHYKLIIVPIGFESKAQVNGEEEIMVNISKSQKSLNEKPLKILCNSHFLIHKKPKSGSYNQRQEVLDKLKNNKLVDFWNKRPDKETTWKSHDNYSFELCPEGNGLDIHRFYEALLLNTIPIVKRNSLETMYKKFPCVILDDWNEVTEENCKKWKKELKDRIHSEKYKLNMDYWYNNSKTNLRTIKKKYLGEEILVLDNEEWTFKGWDGFEHRFINHEYKTNKKLKELMLQLKNTNVIDSGAHVGDTGLFLAKCLKDNNRNDIKVIMIEPSHSKVEFIKKMIEVNNLENYAEVINSGLGDRHYFSKIIKEGHSGMWKLQICDKNDNYDIEINTLDKLVKNRSVGLMHIDVEGFEYNVLKGSNEILKKFKPKIMLEIVHSDETKINGILNEFKYTKKGQFDLDVLYE